MEEGRSAFKILTGKPTVRINLPLFSTVVPAVTYRKRPLGSPRRRWEDNIRMDLEEIGLG